MKSKRTYDEWKIKVGDYKESGLSITGYCKENDLSPSTFIYWIKKFKNPTINNTKRLVKVTVPVETNKKMKLSFNQVTIDFPTDLSADKVLKLISALKEV